MPLALALHRGSQLYIYIYIYCIYTYIYEAGGTATLVPLGLLCTTCKM